MRKLPPSVGEHKPNLFHFTPDSPPAMPPFLKSPPRARPSIYDREGRLGAVRNTTVSTMTEYIYDAEGRRVAKGTISTMSCDPTSNGFHLTASYVLDEDGSELTQQDGSGNWQRTNVYVASKLLATYDLNGLHFHLTDPLGTRRMQVSGNLNSLGVPDTDIQSLPYGDALYTYPDPYAPPTADNATPLHFTGKERDAESGNDYFGARYFASSMGRFLSPDPDTGTLLHIMNPQRWNMYAYALNNPLTMTDPTGKDAAAVNFSGMVAGLGHEAIVVINPDGSAELASFGPAQQTATGGWGLDEPGQVQTYALPTIQFGANGLPTDASMAALKSAAANDMSTKTET
ncbi:MAG: RHS repeat-associated core domain-containing protein, partial [Terracidiphilus sp.]